MARKRVVRKEPVGRVKNCPRRRPATVAPDPEVVAVAKRRQFSPAYKRRIVRAADACTAPGEVLGLPTAEEPQR